MSNLAALIVATGLLVMLPGPNVALIVANSIRYGFREGLATVLGTTVGVGLQLVLVVCGLAAVVAVAAEALTWIRWVGVVYLVWLGIRTWYEPADDLAHVEAAPALFRRGLAIALLNPKTLLFNAAFIPQFVADGAGVSGLVVVAGVYIAVLFAGDVAWAAGAGSARHLVARYAHLRNRLTGAVLVVAGAGLACARK